MLFALAIDTLSTMFTYTLCSRDLLGVTLEPLENICHLQYVDELIIFTDGGQENLQIINLILYLFRGSLSLPINFCKNFLNSTNYGFQPNVASSAILNCERDCLPITYLKVPLSRRNPRP